MKYKVKEIQVPEKIEKIFFVGIKGVGMAPLSIIACEAGIEITGSDIDDEFITDLWLKKKEIAISVGFGTESIKSFFEGTSPKNCLVVTTGAHKGFDNPQSKWAEENKITVLSQGQALGVFMQGDIFGKEEEGIAIAGSHGKTTISSLLSVTLNSLGEDCSYSVGTGEVFPIGCPGHNGAGHYFVAEADEYASEPVHDRIPKFLYLNPKYAIFNNIDFDHPDLFENTEEIVTAFVEFAHNIKSGGKLFINGDDKYLSSFKEKIDKDIQIITYGQGSQNDYVISKIVQFGLSSKFTVHKHDTELGIFELSIPGVHNSKNALSVVALLTELGYESTKIRGALKVFTGTKRRTEIVGHTKNGATIIDDYGHHPLEIATTINAIKQSYTGKKIVCVFQPHTFSRTKALLEDFGKAFESVDKLILLPIFKSARDTEKDEVNHDEYIKEFSKYSDTIFIEKFEDVIEYLDQNFASNEFIILTIGAGDVYKIGYELKS